ncbi:hypothetical protein D9758_012533 [Tetrapyrgos nigripes]|uniref:Uncharacterized protein n=1 Tax=Tetrapyrgos nigripes TaxID=182062 RepID=A0A8H5LHD4_9AGAR|nr:hypothetical protein D9758_012533 [Tetrapyrgos nigripes]
MFSLTPVPFRSLQFLNISCDFDRETASAPDIPQQFKGLFSSADALRQVKLSGMTNPQILGIPWSQLDRLFLEGLRSWRNTFAILRRLARAVRVDLLFIGEGEYEKDGDEEEDDDGTSIVWPHVRTLNVECFSHGGTARLLGLLNAPNMQTLMLSNTADPFADSSSFILFFLRTPLPLQQLTMSVQNIDSGFSNVLRQIPSLLQLHLEEIRSITDDFLHSLVYDSQNQSSVLLPDLTTLNLDWWWYGDFLPLNLDLMSEVIQSRSGGIFTDGQVSNRIGPIQKARIHLGSFEGSKKEVALRAEKFARFEDSLVSFCSQHHLDVDLDLARLLRVRMAD